MKKNGEIDLSINDNDVIEYVTINQDTDADLFVNTNKEDGFSLAKMELFILSINNLYIDIRNDYYKKNN